MFAAQCEGSVFGLLEARLDRSVFFAGKPTIEALWAKIACQDLDRNSRARIPDDFHDTEQKGLLNLLVCIESAHHHIRKQFAVQRSLSEANKPDRNRLGVHTGLFA